MSRCRYDNCKVCNKKCTHYSSIAGMVFCNYLTGVLGGKEDGKKKRV